MTEPGPDGDTQWQPQLKQQTQSLDTIRAGLQRWLRERLDDRDLVVANIETPGGTGVANEIVIVDIRGGSAAEGYVARLATPEPLYLDADLHVHYRMYETMQGFPQIPTPSVIGYEADPSYVGAPFFVMQKIDGQIPTDQPSWAAEGFVAEASPADRRRLWESTVRLLAEVHKLEAAPFSFLRTGATSSGVGDLLDYWRRSLRWADPQPAIPLTEQAEEWLLANVPHDTALSWGDSRLPNVIYRDYSPVGLLDWDLVSLGGAEADLAWWIIMTPAEAASLDGIGSHDDLLDVWSDATGRTVGNLRWFLVFGAYRLSAVFAKLFALMVARGQLTPEIAQHLTHSGQHVALLAGLLDLTPPPGLTPLVPGVRLDG